MPYDSKKTSHISEKKSDILKKKSDFFKKESDIFEIKSNIWSTKVRKPKGILIQASHWAVLNPTFKGHKNALQYTTPIKAFYLLIR